MPDHSQSLQSPNPSNSSEARISRHLITHQLTPSLKARQSWLSWTDGDWTPIRPKTLPTCHLPSFPEVVATGDAKAGAMPYRCASEPSMRTSGHLSCLVSRETWTDPSPPSLRLLLPCPPQSNPYTQRISLYGSISSRNAMLAGSSSFTLPLPRLLLSIPYALLRVRLVPSSQLGKSRCFRSGLGSKRWTPPTGSSLPVLSGFLAHHRCIGMRICRINNPFCTCKTRCTTRICGGNGRWAGRRLINLSSLTR